MRIKRLFIALNYPNRMVLEVPDGRFFSFNVTPSRHLTEADLSPLPAWIPRGRQAEEAPDYLLPFYGLEKVPSRYMATVESDRSRPRFFTVDTSNVLRVACQVGRGEAGETVTLYEDGQPVARALWDGGGYYDAGSR